MTDCEHLRTNIFSEKQPNFWHQRWLLQTALVEAGSNKDKWTKMMRWASLGWCCMDISIHQWAPFPAWRSYGLDSPPTIYLTARWWGSDDSEPAFDECVCVRVCQLSPFRLGPETNMSTYQTSLLNFLTGGEREKRCEALKPPPKKQPPPQFQRPKK